MENEIAYKIGKLEQSITDLKSEILSDKTDFAEKWYREQRIIFKTLEDIQDSLTAIGMRERDRSGFIDGARTTARIAWVIILTVVGAVFTIGTYVGSGSFPFQK
jgi:hypothetical protein